MRSAIAKFKRWFWTQNAINEKTMALKREQEGKFACPRCGATVFEFVTNPTFSTNRMSESRTKAMAKCAGGAPCLMRWVLVSKDYGLTWSVFEPSN